MTFMEKVNDFFLRLAHYRAGNYMKDRSYDHCLITKNPDNSKKVSSAKSGAIY